MIRQSVPNKISEGSSRNFVLLSVCKCQRLPFTFDIRNSKLSIVELTLFKFDYFKETVVCLTAQITSPPAAPPRGAARGYGTGRLKARVVPIPETTDDDWSEAEANVYTNKLIERNKEALHGLAKL